MAKRYIELCAGDVKKSGDEMSTTGSNFWTPVFSEIGSTFDPIGVDLGWKYRRPLKSKVADRSASTNKRSTVRKPQPKLAKRKLRAANR